jgi:hypothetical protein
VTLAHALYNQGTTLAEKHRLRLGELGRNRPGDPGQLVRSFTRLLREHLRELRAWHEDVLLELSTMSPSRGPHDEMRSATLVVRSFGHVLTEHTESLRSWYRESISVSPDEADVIACGREEGP